jgi:STE24 endopeptidase
MNAIALTALSLILARLAAELGLSLLNERHVRRNSDRVSDDLQDVLDPQTRARAVAYTLAKAKFGRIEDLWRTGVIVLLLFSGVLPLAFHTWTDTLGHTTWSHAGFLLSAAWAASLTALPVDWHAQFHLEQRFGFNTTTQRTWWLDHGKNTFLLVLLGFPLFAVILLLVDRVGHGWWFWAWLTLITFQAVLFLLAPVFLLPLFNKLTPLPEGSLRNRLFRLAQNTGFHARDIFVMDGSKRSRHSNAFFTGMGRFRRIVLFDTLIQQLTEPELEAVLAHEVGHYRRRHILKILAVSVVGTLVGFRVVAWLADLPLFAQAFGFAAGGVTPTLLLTALLGGTISFWLTPLWNLFSRRYEFEADRFAAQALGDPEPMVWALRKLDRENLSNPAPHPCYSAFYYSHPTRPERERALRKDLIQQQIDQHSSNRDVDPDRPGPARQASM